MRRGRAGACGSSEPTWCRCVDRVVNGAAAPPAEPETRAIGLLRNGVRLLAEATRRVEELEPFSVSAGTELKQLATKLSGLNDRVAALADPAPRKEPGPSHSQFVRRGEAEAPSLRAVRTELDEQRRSKASV